MASLVGYVSSRNLESFRRTTDVCEGVTPVIAICWQDQWNKEYDKQLFKWYWDNVGIWGHPIDSKLSGRKCRLFYGAIKSAEAIGLAQQLNSYSVNYEPETEIGDRNSKNSFPQERIQEFDQWLSEFHDLFLSLSRKTEMKIPKAPAIAWWTYFYTRLPFIIPAIGVIRVWNRALPIGDPKDRVTALFDQSGPVFDAGRLIIPGDIKIESQKMIDFVLDWFDAGCPIKESKPEEPTESKNKYQRRFILGETLASQYDSETETPDPYIIKLAKNWFGRDWELPKKKPWWQTFDEETQVDLHKLNSKFNQIWDS